MTATGIDAREHGASAAAVTLRDVRKVYGRGEGAVVALARGELAATALRDELCQFATRFRPGTDHGISTSLTRAMVVRLAT